MNTEAFVRVFFAFKKGCIVQLKKRSSAVAERPRNAPCQWIFC